MNYGARDNVNVGGTSGTLASTERVVELIFEERRRMDEDRRGEFDDKRRLEHALADEKQKNKLLQLEVTKFETAEIKRELDAKKRENEELRRQLADREKQIRNKRQCEEMTSVEAQKD